MKQLLSFLLIFTTFSSFAQTKEETYPKTLFCPNDTLIIRYKDFPMLSYFVVSTNEISPGTDAAPGTYVDVFFGKDSLRLPYNNKVPYAHIIYFNLESPKGKSRLRFHYNDLSSYFPKNYMDKNDGRVQFDIPESYELANIIWTLSPAGQRATDLNKSGPYYERMKKYFAPYLSHPVFKRLDIPSDSTYYEKYYDFRENSFAFNFKQPAVGSNNTKLLYNGPYYYVFGEELADSSMFGKLLPLVEDFAKKSSFRKFYKSNLGYYEKQLARQRVLMPMKKMWDWLELQFPKIRYQSYRVVSLPLIGGSHSTQNYATPRDGKFFQESVMFICGTDRYDSIIDVNEKQREGLMSGIVFTEIDHNYVNQTTNKYYKRVDSIFSNRNFWATKGSSADFYGSKQSVFNEYMTHAAFCLYVADVYDKADADVIIANREKLMVERRGFSKFREFDNELLRLHAADKKVLLVDLYPAILDWCAAAVK